MSATLTRHAEARAQQRGIRESDIPIVIAAGTPIDNDSLFLLARDVDREIQRRKREISALERLRGCRVVIAGETIVTVYRPSRRTEKRLLRGLHHHQANSASGQQRPAFPFDRGYSDAR